MSWKSYAQGLLGKNYEIPQHWRTLLQGGEY